MVINKQEVMGVAALGSERTFREVQQAREFWIYSLTELTSLRIIGVGESGRQHLPEKKCQQVHSIIERAVQYASMHFNIFIKHLIYT